MREYYFWNNRVIWLVEALFVLCIIGYGIPDFIYNHMHIEGNINDLESTADIVALWGLSNGKIPYVDFYWPYGPFYLYLLHFLFHFFGSTYDAIQIAKWVIVNVFGILLSYFISVPIFKKSNERILFTLLGVLFITSNMVSLRHLVSEFTLSYAIYCVITCRGRIAFLIVGLLSGLSLLMGFEYGIALLATIIFIFLIPNQNYHHSKATSFLYFLIGLTAVLLIFVIYLEQHHATQAFVATYISMFKNMALVNPARQEFFPIPFGNLPGSFTIANFAKDLVSIEFKFYLPLALYIYAVSSYGFKLIKSFRDIPSSSYISFVFAIYGLIILIRAISGPAYGFLTYGFIPAIVIATFLISKLYSNLTAAIAWKEHRKAAKYLFIFFVTFLWIYFAQDYSRFAAMYRATNKLDNQDTYNHAVGFNISRKLNDSLNEVSSYVSKNTAPNDTIFVYPYGIEGFLSGRPQYALYLPYWIKTLGDDYYYNLVAQDLAGSPPKLVILNKASGEVGIGTKLALTRWVTGRFTEESPIFVGDIDPVKRFIIENYELVFQNDRSAVLKLSTHKPFNENAPEHLYKISDYIVGSETHQIGDIVKLSGRTNLIHIITPTDRKFREYAVSYRLVLSNKLLMLLYRTRVRIGLKFNNDIIWKEAKIDDMYTVGKQQELKFNILDVPETVSKVEGLILEINTPIPHARPSAITIDNISLKY